MLCFLFVDGVVFIDLDEDDDEDNDGNGGNGDDDDNFDYDHDCNRGIERHEKHCLGQLW